VTHVRASCPDCGDVELTIRDVKDRVCAETGEGAYRFRCPRCRMAVSKRGEPGTINLLVDSGAEREVWALPLELAEPHTGGPISADDLLDFRHALYDPTLWGQGLDELWGEPA